MLSASLLLVRGARVSRERSETDASVLAPRSAGDAEGERAELLRAFGRLDRRRRCDPPLRSTVTVQEEALRRARAEGLDGRRHGLLPEEAAAITGWTSGDFKFVNPIARGEAEVEFDTVDLGVSGFKARCRLARQEVMPYVAVVSWALSRLPTHRGGRLWRGHRRPIDEPFGAPVTFDGFTSFTVSREQALDFVRDRELGRSPRRTLVVIDAHRSARYIADLSVRRWEGEVLFPLGTRFRVSGRGPSPEDERVVGEALAELSAGVGSEARIDVVHLVEDGVESVASAAFSGLTGGCRDAAARPSLPRSV